MISTHCRPRPTRLRFPIYWLFSLVFAVAAIIAPAHAQDQASITDINKTLDTVRAQVDRLQKDLNKAGEETLPDTELLSLRDAAQEASDQAKKAVSTLEPMLSSMQARLAELGTPVEGITEAPDIAAQRKELSRNVSTIDAQIKLARLIDVEAGQAGVRILQLRRTQFQAELGRRSDSILDKDFWNELRARLPHDMASLKPVWQELKTAAQAQSARVLLAVLLGIVLVLFLRMQAGRLLWQVTTTRVAPGRLRRSLYATAQLALATLVPGIIADILHAGLNWESTLTEDLNTLLSQTTGAVYFAGFVTGLGLALLSANRPTWRLFPLPDTVASGLQWHPVILALTLATGWVGQKLATLANASLTATVAQNCLMTLILAALFAHAMRRATRLRQQQGLDPHAASQAAPEPMPAWYLLARGLIWLTVSASLVCLMLGYIALGSFISKQTAWLLIVLGSAYLLDVLINDACQSILAAIKRNTGDEHYDRPMTRVRSQFIVLLAGAGRLLIVLFGLVLLAAPFGDGPNAWLQRLDYLHNGITIGEIQLRPASVVFALAVLLMGFGAVKIVQVWLARQYLPTTSLDPGMRQSAATLFGYAGYVLAVALALSAIGIGLERVAWIASALSVGIGFGLQAVVQNFVSGLILLAERPVRVGDWVTLDGGVEGDIRRINVRATEIQMSDRSTVIVPNSEFITKIVRNVTHANPLGRVQIKLTLPANTEADQVHDLMLAVFTDNTGILDEPAPEVMLDSVNATGLVFSATGYVYTPRAASGVRSAILFELLRRFKAGGLSLASPPTMVLKETSCASGDAADSGRQSPDTPAPGTGST